MSESLRMIVIYRNPKDFPGLFVAREFWVLPGGTQLVAPEPMGTTKSLEEIRKLVPNGLVNIGRERQDDPCIEEVWV